MAYQSYPYHSTPSYPPPPAPYYPPQPPAQHYAPPPPPVDSFRSYYAGRLKELTFNSRPLIQELSILAMQMRDQNQWGNMTAVVEEIESAVYRSPAHEKLPKLYLLDSISKNVGAPYTTHLLQQMVPRLYIRTHREVDGVTKVKMEEVISLWRRSGPDGGELYGPGPREAVEREIFGGPGQRLHPGAPAPSRELVTRETVLGAIHATIGVKQGEAAQRAWDRGVQTQLTALMGLSEMLNTRHVQPAELQQIMDQLRGMGYSSQPAYPPPRPTLPPFPPTPTLAQQYPPPAAAPALPPFAPTLHNSYDQPPLSMPPFPSSSAPAAAPAPAPAPAVPVFDANMLSILNSLTGSGGLSIPGSAPRTPDVPAAVLPKERSKLDDYEDMVLSLNLSLSNLDMNRMTALPLDHLPIQCSQCAARFPSDGDQLNAHMDWHARRNKQERNSSGRGAHRRWLPRAEEWVNDIPVAGSSTAPDTIAGAAGATTDAVQAVGTNGSPAKPVKSTEELEKKWVRVPSGPAGAAAAVCPVCKEGFKREWSESEEEWVWRNAVDINGKIMHATCRQQQLTANRLARVSKGRGGSGGTASKSPGMTPDPEPVVKGEPHPLSVEIKSGSEGPKSEAGGAGREEAVVVKQEAKDVAPDLLEPAAPVVDAVVVEIEGGGGGKRKADEDAEEERKRVKVDVAEPAVETSMGQVETLVPSSDATVEEVLVELTWVGLA